MGYKWRSSRWLAMTTACTALFTETLLYGFVVPILPYMLEERLHIDSSKTQGLTTGILSLQAFTTLVVSPIVGSWADGRASKKGPLLLSLALAAVGTVLVACTPSLTALYLGRILQGAAGAAARVLCLGMLVDNAGEENVGSVLGMSLSIVLLGTLGGPIIAGATLDWVGYWAAWSIPLGLVFVDMTARLIMVEPGKSNSSSTSFCDDESSVESIGSSENIETSPLLSQPIQDVKQISTSIAEGETAAGFYGLMARNIHVWASVINSIAYSAIIAGFNTTWPTHFRDVFNWGPSEVAVAFFILQGPEILLISFVGWLRDKIGPRDPAVVGWILLAPLLWTLGMPRQKSWWVDPAGHGEEVVLLCVVAIGIVMPFVIGAGFFNTLEVVKDMEARSPGIFGAHGGRSRAFALNTVGFSAGQVVGPLLCGTLTETVGYYDMSLVLTASCLFVGIFTLLFFYTGRLRRQTSPEG